MPSLGYRLFGFGKLPVTYHALAADPTTLFTAEALSMTSSAKHLRTPGHRASSEISRHSGAVVLTPDRLVVTFGRRAVLDARYGEPAPANDALRFRCAQHGIHLTLDVPKALPDGTGIVKVEIRARFDYQQMANLPQAEQVVAMTPAQATLLDRWS